MKRTDSGKGSKAGASIKISPETVAKVTHLFLNSVCWPLWSSPWFFDSPIPNIPDILRKSPCKFYQCNVAFQERVQFRANLAFWLQSDVFKVQIKKIKNSSSTVNWNWSQVIHLPFDGNSATMKIISVILLYSGLSHLVLFISDTGLHSDSDFEDFSQSVSPVKLLRFCYPRWNKKINRKNTTFYHIWE